MSKATKKSYLPIIRQKETQAKGVGKWLLIFKIYTASLKTNKKLDLPQEGTAQQKVTTILVTKL